jgi:hypothetical protein
MLHTSLLVLCMRPYLQVLEMLARVAQVSWMLHRWCRCWCAGAEQHASLQCCWGCRWLLQLRPLP